MARSKTSPVNLFPDEETMQTNRSPVNLFPEEDSESNERTGWKGVGEDLLEKGWETIKGVPSGLMALPGEIKGSANQFYNDPERAGKNIVSGLGQLGHGILSGPGNLRDYLIKKELLSKESPSFRLSESILPKEFNYPEAMGIEGEQSGDRMLQGVPTSLALGPISKLLPHIPGFRSSSRHELALQKALDSIEKTKEHHKRFLGQGQEHTARASQEFIDFIEGKQHPETGKYEGGLRRDIGSQYDKLAEDMTKERVQLEQTPDLKSIQKSISKLGTGVTRAEKERLHKILIAADSKLKTVSGDHALMTYREIKKQKSNAFKNAYEHGVGPKEHEQWIKKGEELKSLEERTKTMLEKQIGGKYLERLKKIDKEYATKIAPLSENPMYLEMRKHGQTSKNILKYLHGKTPGNETLNAIVEKNPELQRVIVGQKFAATPEKLAQDFEAVQRYKNLNPLISKIIEEQKAIKHIEKNKIPDLKEAVKKSQERKLLRKGATYGTLGTLGTAGALMAAESALGRDWKKDVPSLAAILALSKTSRRR